MPFWIRDKFLLFSWKKMSAEIRRLWWTQKFRERQRYSISDENMSEMFVYSVRVGRAMVISALRTRTFVNALNVGRCVAAVPPLHHPTRLNLNAGTPRWRRCWHIDNMGTVTRRRTSHAGSEISQVFRHHDDTLNFRHWKRRYLQAVSCGSRSEVAWRLSQQQWMRR